MPIKRLPQQEQSWNVLYGPDGSGDIERSFNISLTSLPGKISTVKRIQPHTYQTVNTAKKPPAEFVRTNADGTLKYWMSWEGLWKTATTTAQFAGDSLTNSPTGADADLAVFGRTTDGLYDILYATTGTDIARFNRDVSVTNWAPTYWTTGLSQPALITTYPTILKRFSSAQQDLLFVGNGNKIHSIDLQGNVVYSRLVFFADYQCNWIRATKDRVYIGFRNKNDATRESYVIEYDPLTETSNPVTNYNGQTVGFIHDNVCHIIDIKGWISRFNSNGFSYVAAFPIAYIDGIRFTTPHRNGIAIIDNRPHILMPSVSGGVFFQSFSQIFPAGMWCWEPDTNRVYHKGSMARSPNQQNNYGDANSGTTIGVYGALFALPSTNLKSQDVFAGAQVSYAPQSINSYVGAFSTIVVSGDTEFDNRGWVVTPKFYSRDINAIFRNVVIQYDPNQYPLGRQNGELVVKYRVTDPIADMGVYKLGSWIVDTKFDVTTANMPNIAVGDEVFIINGMGSGLSAHITDLDVYSGTKTRITIDEGFGFNPTGDLGFYYENWSKLISEKYPDGLINDNTQNTYQFDIPENQASWVQFKIEIRSAGISPFRGMSIEEVSVGYQENLFQEKGQRDGQ